MYDVTRSVGAVIVAYRSGQTITTCIEAALAEPTIGRIIVVDNSSDPETSRCVSRFSQDVTYIDSENRGFASACNHGMHQLPLTTEYVAFINPDLKLIRPLEPLVRFLDDHPRSLVAGESSVTKASSARRRVTPRRELLKAIFGSGTYSQNVTRNGPHQVDQLSGALLIARHDYLMSIGGFDERFELYYEDVDICQRTTTDGGGCWLFPNSVALHSGGESYSQASGSAYVANRISRLRYLRKHFNSPSLAAQVVAIATAEFLSRSITRQGEGQQARRRAMKDQLREWRHPGSVSALEPNHTTGIQGERGENHAH